MQTPTTAAMRRSLFVLAVLGCAEIPAAPEPALLWFVVQCDRPSVFWVVRDPSPDPATIWLFGGTDSVSYSPTGELTAITWSELDGDGRLAGNSGDAVSDSLGVGRAAARCL